MKILSAIVAAIILTCLLPTSARAVITDDGGVQYWTSGSGFVDLTDWGTVPTDAEVYIGSPTASAPSTVLANGGTQFEIQSTYISSGASTAGSSLTVTGANTLWKHVGGWLIVGDSASANVTVSNGGKITTDNSGSISIGYSAQGNAVVDGGTMQTGGYFFVNRFGGSATSTVFVDNGGVISASSDLANWGSGTTATVTLEDGLGAFSQVNAGSGATMTVNLGSAGSLALADLGGGVNMTNFMQNFTGAGTKNLNMWNGSAYVNYTELTEGVDYQVVQGTGALSSKWVLAMVPEPGTVGLVALALPALLAFRRRKK